MPKVLALGLKDNENVYTELNARPCNRKNSIQQGRKGQKELSAKRGVGEMRLKENSRRQFSLDSTPNL